MRSVFVRSPRRWLALLLSLHLLAGGGVALRSQAPARTRVAVALPPASQIAEVRAYIKTNWVTLTRSLADVPRAAPDPKLAHTPGDPWPVYVAPSEDRAAIEARLTSALPSEARREIAVRTLPADTLHVTPPGLLYLPEPYVVPGGRFNEMYGWDSYFITMGLLRDNEVERARQMTDNHLYQVRYFGKVLNANRTYYLSRSQPPFLAGQVLAVFERTRDGAWLREAYPLIERYYQFWVTPPHLLAETGLSRYYDLGDGPAPEVVSDERDAQGRTHYDRAREYYRTHEVTDYDVSQFYDRARDELTPLFYKGDRSMRESGFDPSARFGPFSVDIVHYAPVCLNSLLYRYELDAAEIATRLGDAKGAGEWKARADRRREAVNRHLWDEAAGMYLDYSVQTRQRRKYVFATTFYPLWAGLASPAQAKRLVAVLPSLEADGGLLTSTQVTGNQWDAPFGWAPLQMLPVDGLRRYGFEDDADRVAAKFIGMVTKEFREHGVIVEKYDLRRRESDVAAGITFGYSANQVGFGWTNAAYLDLLAGLRQ